MPPLYAVPGEAISLVYELAEPIPIPLRDRFFRRVSALLAGDEFLAPAKIVAACAKAQAELLIAPAIAERPTPSKQPPRSPFRRRA